MDRTEPLCSDNNQIVSENMNQPSFRAVLSFIVVVGILLSILVIFELRGTLGHLVFSSASVIAGIVFMLVIAPIAYFYAQKKGLSARVSQMLRQVALASVFIAIFCILQSVGFLLGQRLLQADIQNSLRYCEDLVLVVEQYRETHGHAPTVLGNLISDQQSLPRILDEQIEPSANPLTWIDIDPYTCNYTTKLRRNVFWTADEIEQSDSEYQLIVFDFYSDVYPVAQVYNSERREWERHSSK